MACIIGTCTEIFGAIFLSGNVIKKITQGIVDIDYYTSTYDNTTGSWNPPGDKALMPEAQEMIGSTSVLLGSAVWQLIASYFAWPVSGTHSVIGAILGFHFIARGGNGVDWWEFGKIVISWFASPLLSGLLSGVIYWPIRRFIVVPEDSLRFGKIAYPFIWAVAVLLNVGIIFTTGSLFSETIFGSKSNPMETGVLWGISVGIAAAVGIVVAIGLYMGYIKLVGSSENDSSERNNGSLNDAFKGNEDDGDIEKWVF